VDILQAIAVVWHTAVAVVDKKLAGEVRTVGTARNPRLTGGALCDFAPFKSYAGTSFMQATFTGDLFHRYIQLLTQSLQNSLSILPVDIMTDTIYGTGATVYSTDSGQIFAFYSRFTFLILIAHPHAHSDNIVLPASMSR